MKQSAQRNRKGGQSVELADFARNFVGTPLSGLEFRSNGLDVNLNSDWDRSNHAYPVFTLSHLEWLVICDSNRSKCDKRISMQATFHSNQSEP